VERASGCPAEEGSGVGDGANDGVALDFEPTFDLPGDAPIQHTSNVHCLGVAAGPVTILDWQDIEAF